MRPRKQLTPVSFYFFYFAVLAAQLSGVLTPISAQAGNDVWRDLGGRLGGNPIGVAYNGNTLVVARSPDRALMYGTINTAGQIGAWSEFPGQLNGDPACVSWGP